MKNNKQFWWINGVIIFTFILFLSHAGYTQTLFLTTFDKLDSWGGGAAGSYNEKFYEEGGWYFHSTSAVRGTADESFGGSDYSFRDRDVFTVKNTEPISGMEGFSFQLRDWMLGSGENRNLNLSFDGGNSWETVAVINKVWFDEYQVYQEFVYYFTAGANSFAAEEFMIELDGGGNTNNGRINIGQFVALGESTQVGTPVFNPPGGLYFEIIEVSITSPTPDASIYYTLDGSEPTEDDHLFTDPILVDANATIKARAFKDGLEPSNVATAEYFIRILLLEKDFEDDDIHSGGWIIHDYIEGANTWIIKSFGGVRFAEITEYMSDPQYPHSWYISPIIELSDYEDILFSFESLTAFRTGDALSVYISEDYSGEGDPSDATWAMLPAEFDSHTGTGYGSWTHSGNIDLSSYTGSVFIGFEYESNQDNNGTWQINNILITASEESEVSSNASLSMFTIGNINVLNLPGLIVDNPETDEGAILYLDDETELQGIEIQTAHEMASFELLLNGSAIDQENLEDVIVQIGNVIIASVTAEDQTTIRHHKLTIEYESSVNETDEDIILIYPNPFVDNIFIKSAENIQTISIINQNGQVILELNSVGNDINLPMSNLRQGLYLLEIHFENGSSMNKKMIKP